MAAEPDSTVTPSQLVIHCRPVGSPTVSKRARKRRGRKKNAANHGKKPNA
jgi:hypothetical protein